ncbi:hypothetical protein IAD21_00592 [Abditibacteriota bacterium]|nr:hypothetical protein IAD21_00592 [Abditibacteriota bacterium]
MRLGNLERMKNAEKVLRVLSFGGGVQSSTELLMILHGELPCPDAVIFADPQWESAETYAWIAEMEALCISVGLPFYRVTAGDVRGQTLSPLKERGERLFASLPFPVANPDGKHAMLRRQCTREFKITPLVQKQRELMGMVKGERVPKTKHCEVWIGISLDEIQRVNEPRDCKWATNCYWLIEKRMTRADCIFWLKAHGYRLPPKSACVGCPFKDNAAWRDMKMNRPDEFAQAVEFDQIIRHGVRGATCPAYLHRSLIPLAEVDFRSAEDMGQLTFDGFINECEGMCGV